MKKLTKSFLTLTMISLGAASLVGCGEDPAPVDPTLSSISVVDPVTEYETGAEFVKPSVVAVYSDHTTKTVTDEATFSGYDMSKAGEYTVAVAYKDKRASYAISVTDPAPHVISERAMKNFLDKVHGAGYTVVGTGEYAYTTAVHDEGMITCFFQEGSRYNDNVTMTVNDETYYALIDKQKQQLVQMMFMDKKPAIDVYEELLPSYWDSKTVSGGNIWTIFVSNPNNPLHFVGRPNSAFNDNIAAMCDLSKLVSSTISDITLDLDAVDVTHAVLNFTYVPGGTATQITKDGSIDITFGGDVKTSDIALAWVNDPNRSYPEPVGKHGKWPDLYDSAISSTYQANIPEAADPFPYDTFFSYATNFNSKTVLYDQFVQIHDFHSGEAEAKQYMQTLLDNGYQAAIGATGNVFRSPVLRERNGYQLFADISITINDGLVIKSQPYYTSKTFGSLKDINDHIAGAADKFIALPASENIISYDGVDSEFHAYEDRAGFYDYNLFMHVYLKYKNSDQMDAYLADYFASLVEAGYVNNPKDGTYTLSDLDSKGVVKIYNNADGIVDLEFYNQKHVLPDEAIANINAAGFADFETSIPKDKISSIMDIKGYYKFITNHDYNHYYSMNTDMGSNEKAVEIANAYGEALKAIGFVRKSDVNRTARYENSDGSLVCLMDYDAHKGVGTTLNLWFVF